MQNSSNLFSFFRILVETFSFFPFFLFFIPFFLRRFLMRPSGTHLYKRVCPSVRPSVRPLRLCKNRVSRLFLATVRSYTETNDQPTCFESLLYHLVVSPVCSSICLSIYVTWSIHAETRPGRIVARSGLFTRFWGPLVTMVTRVNTDTRFGKKLFQIWIWTFQYMYFTMTRKKTRVSTMIFSRL